MYKNVIQIIPFKGKKEKLSMWSGKLMAIPGIGGYHVIIIGAKEILAYDAYKTREK